MYSESALSISLKEWMNPQGEVVLEDSWRDCLVSFGCWTELGEPADFLCQIRFHRAWAVRGVHTEFLPYKVIEPKRSSILVVQDSRWLKELTEQRLAIYTEWKNRDKTEYKHFVVEGHDNYYEIIAESYEERYVSRDDAGDLARLIDDAQYA